MLGRIARRTVTVFLEEGPDGVLARARRRLSSDVRMIFGRYEAWMASERDAPPPRGDRLVSVVTPVKDPPLPVLRATARSVLRQSGPVEWCVADDGSRDEVRRELRSLAASDARVKLALLDASRGISGATNAALELARGELVGFLDHDDELHEDAVSWAAAAFSDPSVGAAYSDEDKLDERGRRCAPFFKPGFSPDFLLSCNYVSHFLVARTALVRELGGLRPAFDGSQDYDLALRLSERARIVHVPRVLYHWRMLRGSVAHEPGAKPWAYDAARRALGEALERRGERARVEPGAWLGSYRIVRELPADWRERVAFFVDADLEPEEGALEALAAHALRADVALVTGRVVGWGRTLESAGLVLGFGRAGIAGCPFRGRAASDPGYFGLALATRDVSAVPSGAFAIEKTKLEALGGVPEDVARVHAGVALALRARAAGLRTVFACDAVLRRRSSAGAPAETQEAIARARRALGDALALEPHLSPHFLRKRERLELAPRLVSSGRERSARLGR